MPKYPLSFTAASLLPQDMATIAEVYLDCENWDTTKATVLEENSLRTAKSATAKRRYKELELRLQTLTQQQLEVLATGNAQDQALLSFLACCKTYPFIANFVERTLLPKVATHQLSLSDGDYYQFFDQEVMQHERLEKITDSTAIKLRSRTLALLTEAGLLSDGNMLTAPYLPQKLQTILQEDSRYLLNTSAHVTVK